MHDVRTLFLPRTLQSIEIVAKGLVKLLGSFAIYHHVRIGYALRDIFCILTRVLACQTAKEAGEQVECQYAHHEHRSGAT